MHARICQNPHCNNIVPHHRRKYCCDYCRKPAWYAKRQKSLRTFETFLQDVVDELLEQRGEIQQVRVEIVGLLKQQPHHQLSLFPEPQPVKRIALEVTRADSQEDDFDNFMATLAAFKN